MKCVVREELANGYEKRFVEVYEHAQSAVLCNRFIVVLLGVLLLDTLRSSVPICMACPPLICPPHPLPPTHRLLICVSLASPIVNTPPLALLYPSFRVLDAGGATYRIVQLFLGRGPEGSCQGHAAPTDGGTVCVVCEISCNDIS